MASEMMELVVGPSAEELAHVQQCLGDWHCVNAPLNEEETAVSSIPEAAKFIIVYARKAERNTLAICGELRRASESSAAPILLVIGQYEISQGTAVERLKNATFIIAPFDEKMLRDKIAALFENLSS